MRMQGLNGSENFVMYDVRVEGTWRAEPCDK